MGWIRLIITFLGCIHALTAFCQKTAPAITYTEPQELTIHELLHDLGELEGVQLSYNIRTIPDARIKIDKGDWPVEALFDFITRQTSLSVKKVGKNYVIRSVSKKSVVISGYVTDAASGESIIGATVMVKDTLIGSVTNAYGFYSLTLPHGEAVVEVSSQGYQVKEIRVGANDQEINVPLKENIQVLSEVIVTGTGDVDREGLKNTFTGYNKLTARDIKRTPAFFGEADVIRAIKMLPGVQRTTESSTGFSVRGGGPDQNMILLDEAVIYNPSHVLGFFSTFNSDAIKSVSFYKGNIPAQFGGRLSSFADIRMKEGNNKKLTGSATLSPLIARLTTEIPITKDVGSVILSARRSFIDLLINDTDLEGANLYFYDVNLKANYRLGQRNRIFASAYIGRDVFNINDEPGDLDADFRWGNVTATLRWNHVYNKRLFSNTSLVFSNYNYQLATLDQDIRFNWNANLRDHTFKTDFEYFYDTRNTIRFGLSSTFHLFQPGKISGADLSQFNNISGQISKSRTLEHALYIGNTHQVHSRWTLAYGLRVSLFQNLGPGVQYIFNEDFQRVDSISHGKGKIYNSYNRLAPRISASYALNKRSSIEASFAQTAQYLHLASNTLSGTPVDIWFPSTPNVRPEWARQFSLGYLRSFKDDLYKLSVETYYKSVDNQVDFKDHAELILNEELEGELRIGDAWSYGVEMMLEKTSGRLNGSLSLTWSHSYRKIPQVNEGKKYRSNFDRPLNVSIAANYRLTPYVDLSINWVYFTGLPFTAPTGRVYYGNNIIPTYTVKNGDRFPDYHRLDAGVTIENHRRPDARFRGSWNISVYNLYARRNANFITFRPIDGTSLTEAVRYTIFLWVPSVSYTLKF